MKRKRQSRRGVLYARPRFPMVMTILLLCCCCFSGCEDTDVGMATQAGIEALQALTLDDEDVRRLSLQMAGRLDVKNTVAPPDSRYARRLQRLSENHQTSQGNRFNFKAYISPQVNAFALADGSIRVYSGLMDMLNDEELLFVLGHEMGHVVNKHVKEKMRLAYAGSAVRKAIASQQNEVGAIAGSVLGALAERLLNAQFSQREEREADDYGVRFLKEKGYGVQPAISALQKLATLGNDHSFLSSHPAPGARAERLAENGLAERPVSQPPILSRLIAWVKGLWPFGKDEPQTLSGFPSAQGR